MCQAMACDPDFFTGVRLVPLRCNAVCMRERKREREMKGGGASYGKRSTREGNKRNRRLERKRHERHREREGERKLDSERYRGSVRERSAFIAGVK